MTQHQHMTVASPAPDPVRDARLLAPRHQVIDEDPEPPPFSRGEVSHDASPRTRSSRSRPWSSLSSDGTYRRPVGSSMMPRIRPFRRTYVQARSSAAAGEGAGVTAGFGAAVRGGSAVTTRATPKIANPPPMSTTPVTGSDKITAPNNTATAGLTYA